MYSVVVDNDGDDDDDDGGGGGGGDGGGGIRTTPSKSAPCQCDWFAQERWEDR